MSDPDPFLSLCRSVNNMVEQLQCNSARLRKIEDRLAKLDGGSDAQASVRTAFDDVNATRKRNGHPPLALKRP
jgi:hypothetical protein